MDGKHYNYSTLEMFIVIVTHSSFAAAFTFARSLLVFCTCLGVVFIGIKWGLQYPEVAIKLSMPKVSLVPTQTYTSFVVLSLALVICLALLKVINLLRRAKCKGEYSL